MTRFGYCGTQVCFPTPFIGSLSSNQPHVVAAIVYQLHRVVQYANDSLNAPHVPISAISEHADACTIPFSCNFGWLTFSFWLA